MKVWQAAALGGLVMMALNQAENESPGATKRSAENLGAAITPVGQEAAGVVGDLITTVRDEASQQGINPTGVFTQPTVDGRDFDAIPSEGAVPGMQGGSAGG